MAGARIRGEDVEVLMLVGGVPKTQVTTIRSFEVTAMISNTQEGYLGEVSDRFDDIYTGMSGSIEFHYDNANVFDVIQQIIDRARRRSPGVTFTVKAALKFPNGQRKRVILQDVFFEDIPLSFGSRSDYGSVKLSFKCSEPNFL